MVSLGKIVKQSFVDSSCHSPRWLRTYSLRLHRGPPTTNGKGLVNKGSTMKREDQTRLTLNWVMGKPAVKRAVGLKGGPWWPPQPHGCFVQENGSVKYQFEVRLPYTIMNYTIPCCKCLAYIHIIYIYNYYIYIYTYKYNIYIYIIIYI